MNPNPQMQQSGAAAAYPMAQVQNLLSPPPPFSSTTTTQQQPPPPTTVPFPNWGQPHPNSLNPTLQHVPIPHPSSHSFPVPPAPTLPSQIPPSSHPFPPSSHNHLPPPQFAPSPCIHPVYNFPHNFPHYPPPNPNFNNLVPISSPFVSNSTPACPPPNDNSSLGFQISNNPFLPSITIHPLLPYNNLGQQVQLSTPMCNPNTLPNSNTQFAPNINLGHPILPQNTILAPMFPSPAHNNLGQQVQISTPMCNPNTLPNSNTQFVPSINLGHPIVPQSTILAPIPSPAHNNLGQQVLLCVPSGQNNALPPTNPQIVPNNVIPCPTYNGPGQVVQWSSTMVTSPSVVHNSPATYSGFGPANQCIRPQVLHNAMSVANTPVVPVAPYNSPVRVGFYRPMMQCGSVPALANSSPSMAYPIGASQFQINGVQFGVNANALNGQITGFRPPLSQQNNQNAAKILSTTPQINCSKNAITQISGQKRYPPPSNQIGKPQLGQNGVLKGRGRFPNKNKLMRGSFNGSMMQTGATTTYARGHSTQRSTRPPRILRINYTAEEVEQWKEERRRNYPTSLNISNKLKNSKLEESDLSRSRRRQLREILAKQAELGCEVAEIPAHYFSDGERGCPYGTRRKGSAKKRGGLSKDNTLLKKLLSEEMGRDRRVLLQVFRFMVINSFKDWPDTPLKFPSAVTAKEARPTVEDSSVMSGEAAETATETADWSNGYGCCDQLNGETDD